MPIAPHLIEKALSTSFPDSKFKLQDTAGDMDHYELFIYCPSLTGSLINKHKAIYHAVHSHIGELPHAFSINIISEGDQI